VDVREGSLATGSPRFASISFEEGSFVMTNRVGITSIMLLVVGVLLIAEGLTWAADKAVMRPRVPRDQIEAARAVTNPLPAGEETIAKGKTLYEGKAFCKVCHGPDGKGLGADIAPGTLKGPLPRNFTDKDWQAARTDGELFWILKNGSKGTAMASFIPLVLTEEEAWQVLRYVRSFAAVEQ
jgi:mono/diheme cytochrome c family protein